ncbi:MAG: hypothetical protein JNJ49_02645 [Bdellovibrionaceae bacterium]|nr:hypothetical protein [Pseudobdellovibrionaceae bacterium]
MWKFVVSILSLFLALAVNAQTSTSPGRFEGGNDFQYFGAVGNVSVQCFPSGGAPSGPTSAYYRCDGYSFSPAEEARFIGPIADADEVTLVATHADRSTRSKSGSYDGRKGQSDDRFNLWISTVFQRPLLKMGANTVDWTLKRKGKSVTKGSFVANVKDNGDLQCPNASETSWDMNDCISSARVCSNYFSRYGHLCQ